MRPLRCASAALLVGLCFSVDARAQDVDREDPPDQPLGAPAPAVIPMPAPPAAPPPAPEPLPRPPLTVTSSALDLLPTVPKNRLTFDPLGLLVGVAALNYERALNRRVTLELSPSPLFWSVGGLTLYGAGFGLGTSLFFTGHAPRGFRFSTHLMGGYLVVKEDRRSSEQTYALLARATLGYNWLLRSGFTLGLAAGAQLVHLGQTSTRLPFTTVLPAVNAHLGYAW